jgi:uncharacterized membrane protein YciS (DUF1049 family)
VKGVHWKIALALVVIFAAGLGTGWVACRQVMIGRQLSMMRPGAALGDGALLKRMEERLKLTAEQKEQLAPMLRETVQRLQAQRRRAFLEQMQTVRAFYEQAEPHFTQAQKDQIARAREQLREKLREEFPALPGRVGGPGQPGAQGSTAPHKP